MHRAINKPKETDINFESATVPYDHGKNCWALPGGDHTISKTAAMEHAIKIHKLIVKNGGYNGL